MHALFPLLAAAALTLGLPAAAQEATIRKSLGERLPQLKSIDEVQPTAMPGLYEVRVGTDLFYTDAKGNYLIQGELFDTRAKRNLTEDRINKLTAVDFSALPLNDAFTIVRGDGKRKLAVFEDPNCGYCKQLHKTLQNEDNLTIYTFLFPILAPDSKTKSRDVWCAKNPAQAWEDWMLRGQTPATAECEAPIQQVLALGQKLMVRGTPAIFFQDGTRLNGAAPLEMIQARLGK